MTRVCAIHQPNFFPWLGYFDKIRRSDVFVFLDSVDYPRSGSGGMASWCSRVKINIQDDPKWVGCNVTRYHGTLAIKDVEVSDSQPWRKKLLKTLEINYAKAPHFRSCMDFLEPLINFPSVNLADFNINAIEKICEKLKIESTFVRQSALDVDGNSTQLLINITQKSDCDTYMCGSGADGYQDDKMFDTAGIKLMYQNFTPVPYRGSANFIPGLSIIDYLMTADYIP